MKRMEHDDQPMLQAVFSPHYMYVMQGKIDAFHAKVKGDVILKKKRVARGIRWLQDVFL